jgi:tetratricopeptide (TPR) repeat protein
MIQGVGGGMTRVGVTIVVALTAVMLLQALALIHSREDKPYRAWSAVLTLILVATSALAATLFGTAALVTVPALGVLVVEGRAHLLLRLFLFTIAISAGAFVQSARAARERPDRWRTLIGISVVVGALAASQVNAIDPTDHTLIRLYGYDLWSPFLLCWICACALEWTIVIVCLPSRLFRGALGAVLIVAMTLAGHNHHDHYFDSSTSTMWDSLLVLSWVTAFAFGIPYAVLVSFPAWFQSRRWARALLWIFGGVGGGLSSLILLVSLIAGSRPGARAALTELAIIGLLGAALVILVVRHWKERGSILDPIYGLRGRSLDLALLAVLASLVAFSCDLFYFRRLSSGCDLAGLALASVLLIEMTSEGPLAGARGLATAVWGKGSYVRQALEAVYARVAAWLTRLLGPIKRLTMEGGWFSKLLWKVIAVAVVVVFFQEIPSCGKTLVSPLDARSLPEKDASLGETVADRMANRISAVMAELRPDMLVFVGQNFSMASVATPPSNSAFDGDWLEVGPAKVPVNTLVSLLKIPLQPFFGTRTVTGAIHPRGTGYELLLKTSTGEAWRGPSGSSAAIAATGTGGAAPSGSGGDGGDARERLFDDADALAFRIVSSDPAWARAGMTTDPSAFAAFDKGLTQWNRYQQTRGYEERVDDLGQAIASFRLATRIDPKFSVAHYRLGLALREDEQPGTAIDAFETAIEVSPRFGTALVALAATLFDFDSYRPRTAGALDEPASRDAKTDQDRARDIWQRVVSTRDLITSPTDRGSAYLGLCRWSLLAQQSSIDDDEAPEIDSSDDATSFRRREQGLVQAYYYCARADAAYSRSTPGTTEAPEVLATRASIYNEMAVALVDAGWGGGGPGLPRTKGCSGVYASLPDGSDGPVTWTRPRSLYDGDALGLLDQAHALGPKNPRITCMWAWAHAEQDDPDALDRVQSADMHVQIGDDFQAKERDTGDIRWMSHALEQYREALRLDPMRLDTMNSFADAFWTGRLRHPDDTATLSPFAADAERWARQAVRLGADRASPTIQVDYAATLGEVLLALGRSREAIGVMEDKVEKGAVESAPGKETSAAPRHPFYDEIRWALAQAYTCAERLDKQGHPRSRRGTVRLSESAASLYRTVRKDQENREARIFSADTLDPGRVASLCPDKRPLARADQVSYAAAECRRSLVLVVSSDDPDSVVHVWGRGVDEWLDPRDGGRAFLDTEARATERQYFVQLVSRDRKRTISPAFWLKTFASPQKNLMRIAFKGGHLAAASWRANKARRQVAVTEPPRLKRVGGRRSSHRAAQRQ